MIENHTPDWMQGLQVVPPPAQLPRIPSAATDTADEDAPLILDGVTFPRISSKHVRGMPATERAEWDAKRLKCKTDQLYLANVMGLDLQENPHRALFNLFPKKNPGVSMADLDPQTKRRMILWPRGHAKTFCTRVEQTQTILNYPNCRICFLTGGDDLAKLQLLALKAVFERPTPEFLYLFPEFCLTSHQNKRTHEWTDTLDELGTQHQFTVPCRSASHFAEPTFKISTAKKTKAGGHFDFLFVDDLVHENNYRSAKALEKCYEDFLSLIPLLEPTGYLVVTGTRYSFGDTYERIMEQAKTTGASTQWSFSIRDCWSTGCMNCSHPDVFHDRGTNILEPPCTVEGCQCKGFVSDGIGGVLFPQVKTRDGRLFGFTLEILCKLKAELGASFFANQYCNNPIAAEEQIFTETMIGGQTLFDVKQLPSYGGAFTFLVGDLAYSEADDRDTSVIFTVQKFNGQLFVTDCAFGHWSSNQLVEKTIELLLAKRPNVMYFERPAGPADSLHNLILARAAQVGLQKVPIEWVKIGNQKGAKAVRINNVQAALVGRRLWLYAGMNGYSELVSQLTKWPRVKHDDFADCLGRVVECPTGYQFDAPPESGNPVCNWLRKLNACEPANDEYPDSGGGSGLCCG